MTIDELIQREAPDQKSEHDQYYAEALREAYASCKGSLTAELLERQAALRKNLGEMSNSHWRMARLMVMHFMLKGELV